MLFSMLLLGCVGDSPEQVKNTYEDLDGEALLEAYNTAICDVYLQEGCIQAFDQCNEPIANYGNWADCMNSQYLSQSHCSNLPILFEEDVQIVSACIEDLTVLDCTNEPQNACIGEDALFQVGSCGDVLQILLQNCSAFGS